MLNQIISPTINFNPSYPTYIDYSLSSTSNNIEITDNKIKGLIPSKNNIITLKLNKYNLSKNFNIEIKNKEIISNINPLIPYLVKGVNNQIYLNPNQKYYVDDFNYKSNDESIIEINNNIIIPKNVGKTSIIISNSNINKEIEVEVHSPLEDFEYNLSNTLNIQLNNKLSSIIEFNNNVAYYIENNNYIKEIDNNYIFNEIGKYNLIYINKNTGIINKTEINCYEDYSIEDININLKEKQNIKFNTNYQDYSFITPSSIIINKLNKNEFEIISLDKGNYNISINALINDEILYTKSININVLETSLTNQNLLLSCNIVNKSDYIALDNPTKFTLSPLADYYIKPFAYNILYKELFNQNLSKIDKEELTKIRNKEIDINKINNKNIIVTSNDENIIKITKINDKYKINPLNIGKTKIIIKDTISSLTKEIEIGIYNYVRLSQEPYTLSGNNITKIKDNNYSVINNSSINLKINLNTASSSYFTINYTSSDETIAKIGLDGNISFFKTGEVIIHATCYDGKSPKYLYSISTGEKILNHVDYEIVFEIKPKLLITDLNSFFLKVRKSIGHFGAFLVLGIFSSLTYLLYFNSKKWKVTLPINYLQGIGLAFLTEFIQLFVPGRVGSLTDVLIDSTGFIISSTIIIIIFIIKNLKKKQK
ncbi:MAG: VanZ family protein [Bacilli bacterium]